MSFCIPNFKKNMECLQTFHLPIAFGLTPAQITKSALVGLLIFAISPPISSAKGEAKFSLLVFFVSLFGFRIFGFRKIPDELVKVAPWEIKEDRHHEHK